MYRSEHNSVPNDRQKADVPTFTFIETTKLSRVKGKYKNNGTIVLLLVSIFYLVQWYCILTLQVLKRKYNLAPFITLFTNAKSTEGKEDKTILTEGKENTTILTKGKENNHTHRRKTKYNHTHRMKRKGDHTLYFTLRRCKKLSNENK